MTFYAGQRVVCIDDNFDSSWSRYRRPSRGQTYTVRANRTFDFVEVGSVPCILLSEIHNQPEDYRGHREEIPFAVGRFRSVEASGGSMASWVRDRVPEKTRS